MIIEVVINGVSYKVVDRDYFDVLRMNISEDGIIDSESIVDWLTVNQVRIH